MRKTQENIITKAIKFDFNDKLVNFLRNEEYSIKNLQYIYSYFKYHKDFNPDLLIEEVKWALEVSRSQNLSLEILLPCNDVYFGKHYAKMIICKIKYPSFYLWLRSQMDYKSARYLTEHNDHPSHKTGLIQDFITRGKDSIYYYLVENDFYDAFIRNSNNLYHLDKFFNNKTKELELTVQEFNNLFINDIHKKDIQIDTNKLIEFVCSRTPFIKAVTEFCKNNNFEFNKDYILFQKIELVGNTSLESYFKAQELINKNFIIKENPSAYTIKIFIRENGFINIKCYTHSYITIQKNHFSTGGTVLKEYAITPDGHFLVCSKSKNIPLSFRNFMELLNNYALKPILMEIFKIHSQNNKFYLDFYNDSKKYGCLIPVSFAEINNYHNKAEFFKTKYKLANKLDINWNKINLNLAYLIIKSYPYVKEGKSQNILLNIRDEKYLNYNSPYEDTRFKLGRFLINIINEPLCTDYENLTRDYVFMSLQTKSKIKLGITSMKKLRELHDSVSQLHYMTKTEKVVIPKDSKFNDLRKKLPKEFEWIKNKKRLINETVMQHHCVWSYANDITKDKCAIYSFVDENGNYGDPNTRYTIEFVKSGDKYYIAQMQKKYDRGGSNELFKYINEMIA